jgi:CarD family transcriptional regulator
MFQLGEHIVYGTNGICRVEEIGPSPYDKSDTRTFYLLIPIHNPMSSTIYTPVDNDRVPMRRLMTREEIDSLMQRIPDIEPLAVPVERQRRELYRTTIGSLEPDGYVRVIKAVDQRRVRLAAARKHFPMTDLEYGRLARRLLYGECAHVLGISEQEAEAYVLGKEA